MYHLVDKNKGPLVIFISRGLCTFFSRIFFSYKAICVHETCHKWVQFSYRNYTKVYNFWLFYIDS
jgi:hypothetical protein